MRPCWVSDKQTQIGDLNFLLSYRLFPGEILDFWGPQVDTKNLKNVLQATSNSKNYTIPRNWRLLFQNIQI